MDLLAPILTLSGLGLLFGLSLSLASKKFCVQADPRIEKVMSKLPGANCGACGKPGCMGFTEGLIKGECEIDKCSVSDADSKKDIAKVLGIELKKEVKRKALLYCRGGAKAKDKFKYFGIKNCLAANLVMGGQKICSFGCIGLGSCVAVCPFDALSMGPDGFPVVNVDKCTACGKCVTTCPKQLFRLLAVDKPIYVACLSRDCTKDVVKACAFGCIACRKCERECPFDAIKVIDNLAVIDYEKCKSCGKCVKVCPRKIIIDRRIKK